MVLLESQGLFLDATSLIINSHSQETLHSPSFLPTWAFCTLVGPLAMTSGEQSLESHHNTYTPLNKTRISKACEECRSKKIRCNGKVPCLYCSQRRLDCAYRQRARTRKSNRHHPSGTSHLNHEPEELAGSSLVRVPGDRAQSHKTPNETDADLASPRPSSRSPPLPPSALDNSERSINNYSVAATHQASPSRTLQVYYGPSSNFALVHSIYLRVEGNASASAREGVEEAGPGLDRFRHRRLFFGDLGDGNRSASAADTHAIMLDPELAGRFLDRYLSTYWHSVPTMSRDAYRRRLADFFRSPPIFRLDNPDTIVLMLALALGAFMMGREAVADYLYQQAKQGAGHLDEVVNVQMVQVHLMMISPSLQASRRLIPCLLSIRAISFLNAALTSPHGLLQMERAKLISNFLHLGNAVRKAVAAGLHKGTSSPWSRTPEEIEYHRTLFWCLYFWET